MIIIIVTLNTHGLCIYSERYAAMTCARSINTYINNKSIMSIFIIF